MPEQLAGGLPAAVVAAAMRDPRAPAPVDTVSVKSGRDSVASSVLATPPCRRTFFAKTYVHFLSFSGVPLIDRCSISDTL